MVQQRLGPMGLAGFFCNGEIGPVGEKNFLHGYTAPEIGQALGLTPGNVRVLQLRALRRAATHLDPEAGLLGEATAEETGPMDDRQWPVE